MKFVRHRDPRIAFGRRLLSTLVLFGVVSSFASTGTQNAPADPAPVLASSRSEHPFSDPKWYPLRTSDMDFWNKPKADLGAWSSLVACVYSNCGHKANDPHGYWAVDFVGDHGDPIYAAGAGKFHVGERIDSCKTTGGGGSWAWIDHGGGVVSRYHHLATFTVKDGQWVTPATKIATMGPGRYDGCGTHYLHFEVRRNGVYGSRYNMGQLKACQGDQRVKYPRAIDSEYGTWNHVPYRNQDGVVPATHSGCVPTGPATAKRPAWTKANRGNDNVKLTWAAPSRRINRVTVSIEPYRPSMGSYGRPYYRRFNAKDRTATVGNLDGGRTYRFRVSFHNSQGNSAWGDRTVATPY